MADARLAKVQESLLALEKTRDLASAKEVVRNVSALLVPSLSEGTDSLFRLFNDQDGKLKANAGWFFSDTTITDKLATYTLETPAESNLDIKVFGVKKAKKGTISWAVGLTPNFEDEPFNGKFNVGIDFIIPESLDRVIVALSKNYVIRTLELKGQLTATFQEILNSWLSVTDLSRKVEFHEILWNSLDLSPINKKFYEGISQRFISLRQHIETSGALDHEHAAQFANRLIGRVIFTWFLDKKSLIEPSLKYFESDAYQDDTDFYREKLESLFFEVLNTPVSDRSAADTSTPYLNGGLFEPKPGDLYKDKSLTFPKNFFDDFLGFLRAYNFTTDESTTEFQQVAIDPEMLGRIFENLLAEVNDETGEQARKAKGAFYTPRQIVDFMCREALKGYLVKAFSGGNLPEERLKQLIDSNEKDFQDQDHNWRRDLKPYKVKAIEALDALRVLDPACGSGAFPMGMMQLLTKVYSRLEPRLDLHKIKLSVIEQNIFGVDIDPMAVEIARLRAWLSLVVDEEEVGVKVQPLPNLDFKFVCANSLLNLDQSTQVSLFEDASLDLKLQAIRAEYFSTNSLSKKNALRKSYLDLVSRELTLGGETLRTRQLKSFRPFESDTVAEFFDSREMFGVDAFDIIVGNPPYIGYKGHSETFDPVRKSSLGKRFYTGRMDYFYFFFHAGLDILRENGILALITTNYFLTATYANKLIDDISSRSQIVRAINFNELRLFESAMGQHNMITILRKSNSPGVAVVDQASPSLKGKATPEDISTFLKGEHPKASRSELESTKLIRESKIVLPSISSSAVDSFLDKVASNNEPLSSYCQVNQGMISGGDRVSKSHIAKLNWPDSWLGKGIFVLDKDEVDGLRLQAHELEIIKPFFKNSDISRYRTKLTPELFLIYAVEKLNNLETRPVLKSHIMGFMEAFASQEGAAAPYLLRSRGIDFDGPKIVAPQRSKRNTFAYNHGPWYASADVYFIIPKSSEIDAVEMVGVLNSSFVYLWLYERGKRKGEALELYQEPLLNIPIPRKDDSNRELWIEIGRLSKAIIDGTVVDDSKSQREIDFFVSKLFGLSAEDEAILERWLSSREFSADSA